MIYPYKRSADAAAENTEDENTLLATEAPEYESFPACTSFYLGTKWNGVRVLMTVHRPQPSGGDSFCSLFSFVFCLVAVGSVLLWLLF